jgi:hypothetical protein
MVAIDRIVLPVSAGGNSSQNNYISPFSEASLHLLTICLSHVKDFSDTRYVAV